MGEEKKVTVGDEVRRRKKVFENVGRTPDGKVFLQIIRDDFLNTSAFNQDSHQMAYNVGQQDMAKYILDMARGTDE